MKNHKFKSNWLLTGIQAMLGLLTAGGFFTIFAWRSLLKVFFSIKLLFVCTSVFAGLKYDIPGILERQVVRSQTPKVRALSILYRVKRFGTTWQKWELNEAILAFLGPNVFVHIYEPKVYYSAPQSLFTIVEDPIGHYFRIKRNADGKYVDRNGETPNVADSVSFQNLTHFSYSAPKELIGDDDFGMAAWDGLSQSDLEAIRQKRLSKLLKISEHQENATMWNQLAQLKWSDISDDVQSEIFYIARVLFTRYSTQTETSAVLEFARKSKDPRWLPVVQAAILWLNRTFDSHIIDTALLVRGEILEQIPEFARAGASTVPLSAKEDIGSPQACNSLLE